MGGKKNDAIPWPSYFTKGIAARKYLLFAVFVLNLVAQVGLFFIKGTSEGLVFKGFVGLQVLSLVFAALLHGSYQYGISKMAVFTIIAITVSWGMESLSIASGFPFGKYYYSAGMTPMLGNVPLIILPVYFAMGYISWVIGLILTRQFAVPVRGIFVFVVPVISAFLMTFNDLCFDPAASYILKSWVWERKGAYFGVPYTNFLGWLFTLYIIFQLFGLYLRFSGGNYMRLFSATDWLFPVVIYFVTGVNFLLTPLVVKDHPELHQSLSLVTLFTIIFSSLLAFVNVLKEYRLRFKE